MKLVKLLFALILVTGIGGFIYLAVTDIPVEQREVTKTIPNERFFGDS